MKFIPALQRTAGWLALAIAALAILLLAYGPTLGNAAASESTGDHPAESASQPNLGSSMPSDTFVHSFQQQVTQQLQSALTESRQEQQHQMQSLEKEQRELSERLATLQKGVDSRGTLQPFPADGQAAFSNGAISAPVINARGAVHASGDGTADAAESGPGSTAPDALRELAASASGANPVATNAVEGRAVPRRRSDANIAPHGFVEGRLLNGVVAIVGGPDRESIVALSGDYRSANGFISQLDGCFALVQGRPEIAAGRIDFKLSRLTCNFPDGASRTWDAAGWLVDADGIRGVKAVIVENLGRKAAVAAAGGALGGIGQRISQQQYQVDSLGGGLQGYGQSSTFIGSAKRDALGGAATGAANAATQSIADYYNLFAPSLQVGGGTPVTVVLANDLRLPPSGKGLTQTHLAAP